MNINEIDEEIKKLEQNEYTTYGNCYKLAVLYTVRDHFPKEKKGKEVLPMSMAPMMNEMPPMMK